MKRKLGPYLCQLSPEARERIVKRLNAPIPITIKVYLDGKHLFSRKISMKPGSSEGAVLLAAVEQSEIKRKLSEGFKAEPGIFHPDKSLTVRLKSPAEHSAVKKQLPAEKQASKPAQTAQPLIEKSAQPHAEKKRFVPKEPQKTSPWVILLLIALVIWAGVKWGYPHFAAQIYFFTHEAYTRTIDAGYEDIVAVRRDHTVLYSRPDLDWFQDEASQWTDVQSVSAAPDHILALKSDGTVSAAGDNEEALNVSDWTSIVKVAAGDGLSFGLMKNGKVAVAGDHAYQEYIDAVSSWEGIIDLDAASGNVIGLRYDGTVVYCGLFGSDYKDALDDWTDIVRVAAGYGCFAGIQSDGTVVTVGRSENEDDEISSWPEIQDIVFSTYGNLLVGLRSKIGDVETTSVNRDLWQADTSDWTNIKEIACSGSGVIGVRADGSIITAAWEESRDLTTADTWKDILTN